jgi:T5SS/PEP-CTERM-associated repeat protein/autotransporter-associated beta strand protein
MFGRTRRTHLPLAVPALVLLWLGAASPAGAQDYTWNQPNTGDWANGANWTFGTAPPSAASTELIFTALGTNSYTATNDIADPFLLKRLTFNNEGTGTITINGGALTFANLDSELINFATGAVAVAVPINLAANALFTGTTGAGTVTLSGTVNDGGGGFGVTTAQAGPFVFTAAGASSVNYLRVGSGTTQIAAGSWTLTNATTADATAALIVGTSTTQAAAFTLSGGATLTTPGNMHFGAVAGSTGNGVVTGTGTAVTGTGATTGLLAVGNSGAGSLTISNGAVVSTRLGTIGRNAGSVGTVVVDGAGSRWTTTETLIVGNSGTGSLTVRNGGQVLPGSVIVASSSGSAGTLTVTGAGSQLVTPGIGNITTRLGSAVTVSAGGLISGNDVAIGQFGTGSTGDVDGGTLTVRNTLLVGQAGTAGLTVRNGGVATIGGSGFIGQTSVGAGPAHGTLTVTGTNSQVTTPGATSFLIFGSGSGTARGDLNVQNGGAVSATFQLTFAQDTNSSSVSVVDAGSATVTGALVVGQSGTAGLTVQNGGTATAGGALVIGANTGSSGTLAVTGPGSTVSATGALRMAGTSTAAGGSASLTVSSGGSVSAGGVMMLYGGGTANVNAGSLTVGGLTHGTAASIGNVNLSNGGTLTITNGLGATYAGVISGAGSVTKAGAGTQTLTAANTYTGATTVGGGTLVLSGAGSIAASPTVTVANGATLDVAGVTGGFSLASGQALRGGGTVTGGVTAAAGSTVAPGTPAGTDDLAVNGDLTLAPGSTLAARLTGNAAGTTYDQVTVAGAGAITLTGSTLTLSGPYTPLPTDVLTVILNGPNIPVTGAFANQPVPNDPLGRLDLGGYHGNVSYFGSGGAISGGNDVVVYNLVPVPEPGAVLAVAAVAGLAAGFRRRPTRRTRPSDR